MDKMVIDSRGDVVVTMADGRKFRGRVVAADAECDIALVQMAGVSGLATAAIGSSSSLRPGDFVVAPAGWRGTRAWRAHGVVGAPVLLRSARRRCPQAPEGPKLVTTSDSKHPSAKARTRRRMYHTVRVG